MGQFPSVADPFPTRCEFCRIYPESRDWSMPLRYGNELAAFENPNAKMTLSRCCNKPVHCECYGYVRIYLEQCPLCREEILISLSPLLQYETVGEEKYKTQLFREILTQLTPESEREKGEGEWYVKLEDMTSSQCIDLISDILSPPIVNSDQETTENEPIQSRLDRKDVKWEKKEEKRAAEENQKRKDDKGKGEWDDIATETRDEKYDCELNDAHSEHVEVMIWTQCQQDQDHLNRMSSKERYPISPRKYEALTTEELISKIRKLKTKISDLESKNDYLRSTVLL